MPNTQYERDFDDLGALKRPGRLDFKTLNNVDDAGDGYPGMQKAIRNYFHEGYLEKDINMNTHKIINLEAPSSNNDGARKVDVDTVQNDLDGFDDELKSLSSVEVQQLQNIGSVTISNDQWGYVGVLNQNLRTSDNVGFTQVTVGAGNLIVGVIQLTETQWGYLGGLDQSLAQAQSPTFVGLNLSADLVTTSTVDGVNISDFKSNYDTHKSSDGSDHSFIDQAVTIAGTPTFVGLTLSANLVTTSTVDGVNVSSHDHSGAGYGGTVDHINLSNKGTKTHTEIDSHITSTSNPHSLKAKCELQIRLGSGASWSGGGKGYILLNDVGDRFSAEFFVDDCVDSTQNLICSIVYTAVATDTSIVGLKYVSALKSFLCYEDYDDWNISDGVSANLSVTSGNKLNTLQITISAVDYTTDDLITVGWYLNETPVQVKIISVSIQYTLK